VIDHSGGLRQTVLWAGQLIEPNVSELFPQVV
jgi:hypothetical protein